MHHSLIDATPAPELGPVESDDRSVLPHPGEAQRPAAPTGPALVSVSALTKSYGRRVAVRDVSFELAPGVTGLLGPNGAGKSTLVRCLAGLSGWDEGEVRIAGIDPAWRARDARGSVGFMPERVSFPPEMRVDHYLRFAAEGKGIARSQRRPAVEAALHRAGLGGVRTRIIDNLSRMSRRLAQTTRRRGNRAPQGVGGDNAEQPEQPA